MKRILKICFLYAVPDENRKVYTGFHHGIAYLSSIASLVDGKIEKKLFYLKHSIFNEAYKNIEEYKPDLILITCSSGQISIVKSFLSLLKKTKRKPFVILGGPHASAVPEKTIEIDGVDAVCIGEGEKPVRKFIELYIAGNDYSEVCSMWFSIDGKIKKNRLCEPVENINSIPWADRDIFDYQNFINSMPKEVGPEFLGSRGCIFDCSYCGAKCVHGKGIRFRDPYDVVMEIKNVVEKYKNIRLIGFHDNIFTVNLNWLEEFAKLYGKYVKMPYWCNTRVECIDDKKAALLKKSGCARVHIGVESGSEKIRSVVLNRKMSNEDIINAFLTVKRFGMKTVAFNMVGLPQEDENDILDTIELNRKIKPSWIILSLFQPYPGTEILKFCKNKETNIDYISDDYYSDKVFVNFSNVSSEKLKYYLNNFVRLVYKR